MSTTIGNQRFESYGEKIRNYLSPYKNLLELCSKFNKGDISESQFKMLFSKVENGYKDNLEKFIKLSMCQELEEMNYLNVK